MHTFHFNKFQAQGFRKIEREIKFKKEKENTHLKVIVGKIATTQNGACVRYWHFQFLRI